MSPEYKTLWFIWAFFKKKKFSDKFASDLRGDEMGVSLQLWPLNFRHVFCVSHDIFASFGFGKSYVVALFLVRLSQTIAQIKAGFRTDLLIILFIFYLV